MKISINQQDKDIQNTTIHLVLKELEIQTIGIAIAVNNKVVPRTEWDTFILAENDKVIIIHATQGG